MKQIPMLFSQPMIRAILAGKKTQTRRLLKRPHWGQEQGWPEKIMNEQGLDGRLFWYASQTGCLAELQSPQPNDLIWAREAYRFHSIADLTAPRYMQPECAIQYETDGQRKGNLQENGGFVAGRLRPGIHMPKAFSRITLHVRDVKVEQLHQISREDCVSEGCPGWVAHDQQDGLMPEEEFEDLWKTIHGAKSWNDNPWVVATSFELIRQNVLQVAS